MFKVLPLVFNGAYFPMKTPVNSTHIVLVQCAHLAFGLGPIKRGCDGFDFLSAKTHESFPLLRGMRREFIETHKERALTLLILFVVSIDNALGLTESRETVIPVPHKVVVPVFLRPFVEFRCIAVGCKCGRTVGVGKHSG